MVSPSVSVPLRGIVGIDQDNYYKSTEWMRSKVSVPLRGIVGIDLQIIRLSYVTYL